MSGWTAQRSRRRPALVKSDAAGRGTVATRRHRPDYWLLIVVALLLTIGLITVYSIGPGLAVSRGVSDSYYVTKQLIAIGLGLIVFVGASLIPIAWWKKAVWPLAALAIIGSLVVIITPIDEVYRAHRWIKFGGVSFQIAELIKLALIVGMAWFLSKQWNSGRLSDSRVTQKPLLILIVILGIVVAKLQSDLGSTAVMLAIIGVMAFVVGMPLKRIALITLIIAAGVVLAIASTSYRRDRLSTFLHPESDCQNVGYQACQALIAVGSGGVFGLGLGGSVQAYGYLPEAANDSIFAIMAEKFGFIGVSIILGLYCIFIARLKRIAERTPDQFSRLLVIGVMVWIATQAIINIGAMIGLLPLKGITLPFVSSGGTSLVFLTAALGIVFQISRYTSYSNVEPIPATNEAETNNPTDRRRFGRPYNPQLVSRPRN